MLHRLSLLCALCVVPFLQGCEDPGDPTGPMPVFTLQPDDFWDAPWPSDLRRDGDGTISMRGFPSPGGIDLIDTYLSRAEELPGFGTSSPIYLPLEEPIDLGTLPDPARSMEKGAGLMLFDIDPDSPSWGERIPVHTEQLLGPSEYYRDPTLAVAPVPGFPLRPDTTYALVLTTEVATPNPDFVATLDPDHPDHPAELVHALWSQGLDEDDLAIATVLTTYDPLAEMARIAHFLQHDTGVPDLSWRPLDRLGTYDHYVAWSTTYKSPVFTHGVRPYNDVGGSFVFDENGVPEVAFWDDMRLSVCAPRDLASAPPGGFPVVINQHGTGGDYRSDCNSNGAFEPSNRLGEQGVVMVGIDQPLHGTRDGGGAVSDLTHFNFINPDSGLTNFRQGAADAIYLAHALASRPWDLRTEDGQVIPLDPERVSFLGHSQGGLTGGIAAPFLGADTEAVVLSGAGGVLSITLVERKDILDFALLIEALLGFEQEEKLTVFHPANGLIQTLSEVTDTVNYAPFWFSEKGNWKGHTPANVLLTNGTLDANTPYQTAIALAAAGRLPIVEGAVTDVEALDLRRVQDFPLPMADDARAFDGQPVTAGFSQYWQGSHFVIYEIEHAAQLYTTFLSTAGKGRPVLSVEPDQRR